MPVPGTVLAMDFQNQRRPQGKDGPDLDGVEDEDNQEEVFITACRIADDTTAQSQHSLCFVHVPASGQPLLCRYTAIPGTDYLLDSTGRYSA